MSNNKAVYASDTVYNVLYENIINVTLKPGTLMSEKDISQKFQVSRTPVREAFIKLSNMGLVDIIPQKGTYVSKIDLQKVEEERFLRESIEVAILREYTKSATEEELLQLEFEIKKQEETLEKSDYQRFMTLDNEFHYLFFKNSNRKRCYEAVQNFYGHYSRVRYLSMAISGVSKKIIEQHKAIIEAVGEGDSKKAQDALLSHLRELLLEEEELCIQFPDYFLKEEKGIDFNNLFAQ